MRITFLGEHRTRFQLASTEGDVAVLGSFDAEEVLLTEKWQAASSATVKFTADDDWVSRILYPGALPAVPEEPYQRARYFSVRKEDGKFSTFILQNVEVDRLGNKLSRVEVTGSDPRSWAETMPSAAPLTGELWTSTRSIIAERLTRRLCSIPAAGVQDWQRLPILAFSPGYEPIPSQREIGVAPAYEVDPGTLVEIPSPDPYPIADSLEDLLATWKNVEIYPLEHPGADGTASPFWRWVTRRRVHKPTVFSEEAGSLKVKSTSVDYMFTEVMTVNPDDPSQFAFAGGTEPTKQLRGPWAGMIPEEVKPPEGVDAFKWLSARALGETSKINRLSIEAEVDFTKAQVAPTAGMTFYVRLNDVLYRVPASEITKHYSSEYGWRNTAAVFIETDTVDDLTFEGQDEGVEFVVNGTFFSIPVSHASNSTYNWDVYADSVFQGSFSGVGSGSSAGILINFVGDGEHLIEIQPSNGQHTVGWARAFGFTSTTGGANSNANKQKLLRINSDPDFAHLESESSTGDSFRARQFYNCSNLTTTVEENLAASVDTIGNDFRREQFSGCTSLLEAPRESMPPSVITVGSSFRREQYDDCESLQFAAVEEHGSSADVIGEYFRTRQYYDCSSLVSPSDEASGSITDIPAYYRSEQYKNCSNLISAATESLDTKAIKNIASNFRAEQYSGCNSLLYASPEVMGTQLESMGTHFRAEQYYNCWALVNLPAEVFPAGVPTVASHYRYRQYWGNRAVLTAAVEDFPNGPVSVGNSFREQQYYGTSSTLVNPAAEVLPSSVVSIGDSFRRGQYERTAVQVTAAEVMPNTVVTVGERFRDTQYSRCSSLITVTNEVLSTSLVTAGRWFRNSQFDRTGPVSSVPAEAAMPNLEEVGNGFRQEQWLLSGVTVLQEEAAMPKLESKGSDFRMSQYRGSSVKNPNGYSEGALPLLTSVSSQFRYRQFEASNIETALTEVAIPSEVTVSGSYRSQQYQDCSSLVTASVENSQAMGSFSNNYRQNQYEGCVSLDARGLELVETVSRGMTKSTNYRDGQYAGTVASDSVGNRVKYLDGAEVEEGVDGIPASFYTA